MMPSPYPPTPSPAFIPHLAAIEFTIGGGLNAEGCNHRWLFLRPGCIYPLIPADPDRKWIAGQVTSPGGPSCPHVASQEGRMRSVVLRRHSLALPSSTRLEKPDYWFQARLSSCSLFFYPYFCLFHFPSSSLLPQHPLYPILTSFLSSFIVFSVPLWDVSKHCGHWQTATSQIPVNDTQGANKTLDL